MTQFCIEEACLTRLAFIEARMHETPDEDKLLAVHGPKPLSPHEELGARHAALMREAQS